MLEEEKVVDNGDQEVDQEVDGDNAAAVAEELDGETDHDAFYDI